jgi:hypothetical protein
MVKEELYDGINKLPSLHNKVSVEGCVHWVDDDEY